MKLKLTKLLIYLLVLGGLGACSVENVKTSKEFSNIESSSTPIGSSSSVSVNNSSSQSSIISTPSEGENLTINAQLFVNAVNRFSLENISISDKADLDGARFIYTTLTSSERGYAQVINAKAKLDLAIEQFNLLYNEFFINKEAEETGYAFAELVDTVKDFNSLVREDIDVINEILKKYDLLSDSAKSLSVVIEAKASLEASKKYVESLVSMSADEYAVVQFIASVNKLPSVEEMTILDVDNVTAAGNLFALLSSTNKANADVKAAKAILDTLVIRANQLRSIQANADAFIEMVWSLPSYDQLEWKNASQNSSITAAENAYNNLSDEEKAVTGVSSAYSQLQAVRTTFDGLKEPYDISKLSFSIPWGSPINVGGKTNYTCKFTYTTGKDHITVLTQQYGITRDELTKHVKVNLNMYIEAGAVAGSPLYSFDITESWSNLDNAAYVKVLKELQANGDERIFSGMGICFTLNIESLNDQYASSKYSSFMAGQKIYWEV